MVGTPPRIAVSGENGPTVGCLMARGAAVAILPAILDKARAAVVVDLASAAAVEESDEVLVIDVIAANVDDVAPAASGETRPPAITAVLDISILLV